VRPRRGRNLKSRGGSGFVQADTPMLSAKGRGVPGRMPSRVRSTADRGQVRNDRDERARDAPSLEGACRADRLSVQVLGTLRIRRGREVLTARDLGGPRQRQVLLMLVLQPGTPMSKEALIEGLWPGRAPVTALPTLESYISVLRRALQPHQGRHGPLRTVNGGYVMDETLVSLDLHRFHYLARTAQARTADQAYPILVRALKLAAAPLLLGEPAGGWLTARQARHAAEVMQVQLAAAQAALTLGRTDETAGHARAILEQDPLHEQALTVLMHGLEGAGRPVEGLQAYEQYRQVLHQLTGHGPAPTLQAVQARLLQAAAGGSDDLGPVITALLTLHRSLALKAPASSARLSRDRQEAAAVVQTFVRRALAANLVQH
jgi:DNA-binding SARP family transcriptional activator